jgi:hypothetical protein
MIVSHKHKFIFAAVPKTGTHSVRVALRAHLGPADLEQAGLFVKKQFPFPALAAVGHGHLRLDQIRPYVGDEAFASYFKFAFVRNPFDRFVSYCSFIAREGDQFVRDPRRVMRHFALELPPTDHILFHPQHTFLTGRDGALLADKVGRVEDMQASYDEIAVRIGVPSAKLEQLNGSRREGYRAYYDQELIDAVARHYRRDLELFGYTF